MESDSFACFILGLSNENLYSHKDFDPALAKLLSGFISRLDPPVCLVAHNGNRFDFGLLQVELQAIGHTLPSELMCVDSLQMFRHLDLAEGELPTVAPPQGVDFCTPGKQVTSAEKLADAGSSSLRKRKPESVVNRVPPESAKKRLFESCDSEENGVGLLNTQDVDGDRRGNRPEAGDGDSSCDSWSLDVTDADLLAADMSDVVNENVSSDTSLHKDTLDVDGSPVVATHCISGSTGPCIAESIHQINLRKTVGVPQAISDVDAPCDNRSGVGASTPAKQRVMATSILLNTPPYSPGSASKMAARHTPGSSAKKCYALRELHRRVVGFYPPGTHQAEGDCLALVRLFQSSAPCASEWADHHAVPFSTIPPLYKPKSRSSLPGGVFPYQV